MRFRPIAIMAAIAASFVSSASVSAGPESFNQPKHYYLALGDSLAFGYQQAKFNAEAAAGGVDATTFNTGYVDDFGAKLRAVKHPTRTVNFGCPGETTASYFSACAWHAVGGLPLHDTYSGSQESAALAFIGDHRNQVSPITLDLGANDTTPCLSSLDPACVANALARVGANLDRALGELRAAAPNAEIIVMTYYDPYAAVAPQSLAITHALNNAIRTAAAAHGVRVADAFTPINLGQPQPATLCALTLVCTALHDIHASDAGYAVIAQQFWAASDYSRLGH